MAESDSSYNRICVIGTTGAGKSTLGAALARRLNIPFLDLDVLFWKAGWQPSGRDEFRAKVERAVQPPRWVVAGNFSAARDLIWRRADTVVWLDYAFPVVFGRLLRRTMQRIATREALWAGNRETFRAQFLSRDSLFLWALKTHWRRRREMPALRAMPEHAHLRWVEFRTPKAADIWLKSLEM